MPGLSRPAEGGMRPFMHYASLQPESLGAGHPMGGLQSLAGSHDPQQTFVPNSGGLVLSHFIQERGPWTPLGMGPVSADPTKGQQPATTSFNPPFTFDGYRNPHPPSEADTVSVSVAGILSDSGYGSMARQSVGNPSVYGGGDLDHSFETQSLISRFQMIGQDGISSKDEPRKREARVQRHTAGASNGRTVICPDCNAAIKTNSELKYVSKCWDRGRPLTPRLGNTKPGTRSPSSATFRVARERSRDSAQRTTLTDISDASTISRSEKTRPSIAVTWVRAKTNRRTGAGRTTSGST